MSPALKQQVVGEHVRRLRTRLGLSVRDLASRTSFSPSFISQVENGQASPSISSMERIAHILGVSLGEFFAVAGEARGGRVLKATHRQVLESGWSNATVEILSEVVERIEPMVITLGPGGRSGKHPYGHATEEFGLVLEGEMTLTLGPQDHVLGPGDAVTILPGELRVWRNPGTSPARVLVVSLRSPASSRRRNGKGLAPEARQVLRAVAQFAKDHLEAPLPLKRIALDALEGDPQLAARALQDLDGAGLLRTDTMGWQTGWLTSQGLAAAGDVGTAQDKDPAP